MFKRATVAEMLPPPEAGSVGGGEFAAIGAGLVEELKAFCGLLPHHHVLDVGCGTGRVAIPLTQYLSPAARYEGFDPVARAIDHCRARIAPSYPNFRFQVADVHNRFYNPRGRFRDAEYAFPYESGSFDVVFAASVFTHLLPPGCERYLAECARVLKPGGRLFATYFLLNEAAEAALEAGKSSLTFRWRKGAHRLHDHRRPEAAVAYDEPFVTGQYACLGLEPTQPAGYGTWSGRSPSGYGGYQDLLVASKRQP